VFEQVLEPLIRIGGRAETGKLAHGPQPTSIHLAMHASGKWELTRLGQYLWWIEIAQIVPVGKRSWSIGAIFSHGRSEGGFRSHGCWVSPSGSARRETSALVTDAL
jgi:hypothetical protein